jgi:hypothetical protein
VERLPPDSGRSEAAAAGSFDPDEVAGRQLARGFRRQFFAVQEIAARFPGFAAFRASWRVPSALRDDREAARLEDAKLPDDAVPAAVAARAARAEPE